MQKIRDLLKAKAKDNWGQGPLTFAFLGDSVTQTCFELYKKSDGSIDAYYDAEAAYHHYLKRMLALLYPSVPVNILNAGIGGDNAPHGLERLERDVIVHHPDLAVVCYGLNDSWGGLDGLSTYGDALGKIFDRLQEAGIETLFMTPNMMCTEISCHLKDETILEMAKGASELQKSGVMDQYMETARKVCAEHGVPVCDCYAQWKTMHEAGVDTTELLANQLNHPTREMNWLFAVSLLHSIFNEP